MAEVTFSTKYEAGHTYQHTWTATDIYCPGCGKRAVWRDTSGGDYYVGEQHMCMDCQSTFHMPSFYSGKLDYVDQQTFDAIRSADEVGESQ